MSIKDLKPKLLWEHFLNLTKIPRPSGSEAGVRKYLAEYAKKHNFKFKEETCGNVIIEVPGKKGFENKQITVLQAHLDMVTEKNQDSKVDPTKDPLDVYRDGDFIQARGTTLGADNGIGVAAALAVAEDIDAKHGPLELLFTVEEETALVGAFKLEKDSLKGRRLINLDSEDFGIFFVGCAGGADTIASVPVDFEKVPSGKNQYSLKVLGLKGGHSGVEIIQNRANAIKILSSILKEMSGSLDYRLVFIKGGNKRNSIPREAQATVLLNKADAEKVNKIIRRRREYFLLEYSNIETEINISLEPAKDELKGVMPNETRDRLLNLIIATPSAVIAMSRDIQGMVETSTNLGVVETKDKSVEIVSCRRSSVTESLLSLRDQIRAISELAGAKISETEGYPGWKPDMKSALLKFCVETYENLYKSKANVTAIHAGLECGIIGDKFTGMDMISFGPDIRGVHSPDEKVSISSTQKFYEFFKHLLSKLD